MKKPKLLPPKLVLTDHSPVQVTVFRGGDVISEKVGRTRMMGDTRVGGKYHPRKRPLPDALLKLPVAGDTLTPSEARHWARVLKKEL